VSAPAAILWGMSERILEGLNAQQRAAATAVRGPVCIVAGAGTGKTTTITRRIAYQIATDAFPADRLLAVTFTDRAANELRERLSGLGVPAVRARTFHAEALAQVAHFTEAPKLLPSKARLVGPLVRKLPGQYRFRATKDIAGEIEWAKNRRLSPQRYLTGLGGHEPPIPRDLMHRVYVNYEAAKRRAGMIDFEDLLEMAIALFDERPDAAERIRDRYRAITVDEFQDVNLLQATLLDAWLGGRDEVCVVGDDHQSIYGFTGASPERLIGFKERYPHATVVALTTNYRSTPQVLELANRLVPRMGGIRKELRSQADDGPVAVIGEHPDERAEAWAIVSDVRRLHAEGVPLEQMAVLYRINARSEEYEEAFAKARIAFQVRDGSFLERPGPRTVLTRLGRLDPATPAAAAVREAVTAVGWEPDTEPEGAEEIARQADLTRLVHLSDEAPDRPVAEFVRDVRARFASDRGARGVTLSTYHRAKGLEWEAVFLPRLEEREMPFALAKADADVDEERRLLYVGITRARRHLRLSWCATREGKRARRSRFIEELMPDLPRGAQVKPRLDSHVSDPDLFSRLRAWRKEVAEQEGVPAYVIFHDATLRAICDVQPGTLGELGRISGIGPTKLSRWGSQVLEVVGG